MLVAYVADKNAGGAVVVVSTSSHCSRCSACIALSLRLSSPYSCCCCSFSVSKLIMHCYSTPIRQRSIVMSVCVCLSLCVCLSAIMSSKLHVRSSRNFLCMLPMAVARSSSGGVVKTSDKVRISSFIDDVIFAHKLRLLEVAARLRQSGSHAGLARRNTRCRQRTVGGYFLRSGPTRPHVATPGAESAVYDCLVYTTADRSSNCVRWTTMTHKFD